MKTLEEIKEHLSTTVYDEDSKQRIAGFLIGKEIGKEEGILDVEFELPKSFEDFVKYFNESEEEHPNAKVLKDGKWFDITFDEICKNLKDFNPVICDKVLSDDVLTRILDELGLNNDESKNSSNKYKERELSIIDSMGLDKINPLALSTEALKAVNNILQRRNELEKELNEKVD